MIKNQESLGMEFFPQWEDETLLPAKRAVIDFIKDFASYDIRSDLKKINIPTYVCIGSEDAFVEKAKLLGESIKNSKFEIMKGYVHNITIDARDVLPQKIEEFLYQNKS